MEINDNPVKIAVRERQIDNSSIISNIVNENVILVSERVFPFDFVLRGNQKDTFLKLGKPLVQKTLDGYNSTCLAYGQTGTGKTFSMGLNSDFCDSENAGIIPRCLREIFENISIDETDNKISISFIEIYNEKVYDMLSDNSLEQINTKGYKFIGGIKKEITNIDEAYKLLKNGNQNRHVRPTKMNSQSSRSHAIFTIHILKSLRLSCLNLVDLAGSEGIRRTGHQGIALEEGVNINQGLLAIGKVLQAVVSKNKVIPYRDSVLTSVLQDSLNINSYFTLLACISPLMEDLSETLSTLRFSQNAKLLKNDPQINAIINEIKKKKANTPLKSIFPTNRFKLTTSTPNIHSFMNSKRLPLKSNTFCTPNKKKKN